MAPKRITINDLARELGLTKATVSRALNGYEDIALSTRERVLAAAQALGYRPLAQAQAIRTGQARSLGLVLAAGKHNTHKPFLTDFLDGISRTASEESWTLTVATAVSEEDELQTLERLVHERKVDGFILPRTRWHDRRVTLLRQLQVPFVMYGRTQDSEGCAWFDIQSEDAMTEAVIQLYQLGHRRIAFMNGLAEYTYAHLRLAGYQKGLAAVGLPFDARLVRSGAMTLEQGEQLGESLLRESLPPTAVVSALDLLALGFYHAANERGLVIGRDISLISYDGIPEAATARPALSTYAVDTRAAGVRLAQMLFALIRGTAPETLRETIAAQFISRHSHATPAMTSAELAAELRTRAT